MENDVLRNKIAPWQEKGRWYHGIYDIATSAVITEKTDKFLLDNCGLNISASYIFYGPGSGHENIKVLDSKIKLSDVTSSGNQFLTIGVGKYVSSTGYLKPAIAHTSFLTGTVEFWFFIVEE